MAEQKQNDQEEESVKHDFSFKANLDNKKVELECNDSVTGKSWKVKYDENDYNDIDNEFDKMKQAIEGGNAEICPPDDQGNLVVKAPPYTFTLKP
eukprot:153839_1